MSITPDFNKYPKIANFDEVIFIAQQAYELGFRGGTGRELYNWLQTRLDLTGLSNTAGLPEDFPEPNTQLSATNKGEWTILTPGTYQKQTTGEIVVPDNQFAFAQFDGTDYNLVKFVEMSAYEPSEEFNGTNEEAVKGNVIYEGTIKPVDLTIEQARTNQLYNKDLSLKHSSMSNAGVITTGDPGGVYDTGLVSDKIEIKEGETNLTISGTQGTGLKYVIFFNSDDEKVGSTGEFYTSPYTRQIVAGSSYFRVYINSRHDPAANEDLFMINWGQEALPVEPFYDERITKIKDIKVGSDVDLSGYATINSLSDLSDSVNDSLMDMGEKISSQGYVDDRYIDQFPSADKLAELERMEATIKSLRSLKSADSGNIEYVLPNGQGAINEEVVIPVNVHWGASKGDVKGGEIFMNESCRKDFSDLRFLDMDDNLLDAYKVSNGNYEFIYDDNIKGSILGLSNGHLLGSGINESEGISISTDNMATWTSVQPSGAVCGLNANDDLLFGDGGILYKSTKASGYTSKTAVLSLESSVLFRYQSFAMDDQNNLYLGAYQEDFNVRIYKSTDGGDTWSLIYTNNAQHVHSLIVDKTVTPHRIFANIDGAQWEARYPRTVYTNDRGATWNEVSFFEGITPDYGVLYARGNILIGSGEGDIKGFPSIYRSANFGQSWNIVMNASINLPIIIPFKGGLYAMNFARGANVYPTIYRSDDEGITWTTIQNVGAVPRTYNSVGWRYGALRAVRPSGDVDQLILTGTDIPPMRIKAEDDNHQSLWYVKVSNLPNVGRGIKVAYGYLAQDVEANLFRDLSPTNGLIAHLPLNEFGNKVRELVKGKIFDITGSEWEGGVTKRFAKTVPYRHPSVMGGVTIKKDLILNGVEYGLNFRKNFTANFWYKMKMDQAVGNTEAPKFLFGTKDNSGFNFSRQYRTQFRNMNNSINRTISNIFRTVTWTEYQMFTIVVTNDSSPIIKVYINGRQVGSVTPSPFNQSTDFMNWKIGGGNMLGLENYINDDAKMTDFKLWNRVLTDAEILKMFEGNKFISVK